MKITILLIEDNQQQIDFLTQLFNDKRYKISTIKDGKRAYDYLSKVTYPPDIILIDNFLPSMNGIEIITKIKNIRNDLAFIFLTIDRNLDTAIKAMKAGSLDFITKDKRLKLELVPMVEKIYKWHQIKLEKIKITEKLKEREEYEKEQNKSLVRKNLLLKILFDCGNIILHATNEQKLINDICKKIINIGTYKLVWFAYCKDDNIDTKNIIAYGKNIGYVSEIIKKENIFLLPEAEAIFSNEVVITERKQSKYKEWSKKILKYTSFSKIISIPIKIKNKVIAIINIYSDDIKAFTEQEANSLIQLTNNLAYGIYNLRLEILKAEQELEIKKNKKRYQIFAEHFPDSFLLIINHNCIIEFASGKEFQNENIKIENIISKKLYDIFGREICINIKEFNKQKEIEFLFQYTYNSKVYQFHIYKLKEEKDNILIVAQNITKQKTIEEDLKKSKKILKDTEKLKMSFLSNISHEIRTPLNGIINFSDLLILEGVNNRQKKKYKNIISTCSYQLLSMVDNILLISNIRSENITIRKSKFNLNKLLDDLFISLKENELIEEKNQISLFIKKDLSDENSFIETDRFKLNQILTYLLSNAIKFTHRGSIKFGYFIKKRNQNIEFFVEDTGIGLSKEDKIFIYEPFRQIDYSDTRKYGGLGLGLPISKALIKKLGGEIGFISKEKKGSRFYFTIAIKLN